MSSGFQDFAVEEVPGNQFVNRVPIACGVFDAKGSLVSCNENWLAFFNMDCADGSARDFSEFLPKVQPCGTDTYVFMQKKFERVQEKNFAKLLAKS